MFYHLERQSLEEVLPVLLEKTLARGWRAVVETPDAVAMDALDRQLWTYRDESFLPHASEREDDGARQPVWLTTGKKNPNGASVRFLAHRAEPADIDAYERIVFLFSAHDADAVAHARSLWKPLKEAGHACTYWRQSAQGGWEKKG